MKNKDYIIKLASEFLGKEMADIEIEKEAEYILPAIVFKMDLRTARNFVLNEDMIAGEEPKPVGIDFIKISGPEPQPVMVQVKTGTDSKKDDISKIKIKASEIYEFFKEHDAKILAKAYDLDENIAYQIKEELRLKGYTVAYMSLENPLEHREDISIYNKSDMATAIMKHKLPFYPSKDTFVNFMIKNGKSSSIIHSDGNGIDIHLTIKKLIDGYESSSADLTQYFEFNVRSEETGVSRRVKGVKEGIKDTMINHPTKMLQYNNGLTIITETLNIQSLPMTHKTLQISMTNPSIVNGQQTFRTILGMYNEIPDENRESAKILVRIREEKDEKERRKISISTNKMIKVDDMNLMFANENVLLLFEKLLSDGFFMVAKYKATKEVKEEFKTIMLKDILSITRSLKTNEFNWSNIRTQILDDTTETFNDLMEEISEDNYEKVFKNVKLIYIVRETLESKITDFALHIFIYTLIKARRNEGTKKNIKNKMEFIKILKKIDKEVWKIADEFKKSGKKTTTKSDIEELKNSFIKLTNDSFSEKVKK